MKHPIEPELHHANHAFLFNCIVSIAAAGCITMIIAGILVPSFTLAGVGVGLMVAATTYLNSSTGSGEDFSQISTGTYGRGTSCGA